MCKTKVLLENQRTQRLSLNTRGSLGHWGNELTIGASGFGVSLEDKFSVGFGEKIDTGEEDSAGTSETLTKEIDFDFPPLRNTLLPLTTAQAHTRGPLTIRGRRLPGLRITMMQPTNEGLGGSTAAVTGPALGPVRL